MFLLYLMALVATVMPAAIVAILGKVSRIKEEEFSIGIGPKIAGVKLGETVYLVRLILLGSYVKFDGESYRDTSQLKRLMLPTVALAIMYSIGILAVGGLDNAFDVIKGESTVLFYLNNSAHELKKFSSHVSEDMVHSFGVVVICTTFYDTIPLSTTLAGGIIGAICETDIKESQSALSNIYNTVSIIITLAIVAVSIFLVFKSFGFDA
jgi:membrane-associated protease RseP (regulator of RpoE activity)